MKFFANTRREFLLIGVLIGTLVTLGAHYLVLAMDKL